MQIPAKEDWHNRLTNMGSVKKPEKHYCRGKVALQVYLPSDINISKLWRMYNSSVLVKLRAKPPYLRNFFHDDFNIVFGSPATTILCWTCIKLRDKLNRATVHSH
ncbi:hypothetical protein PR048_018717 [Dryococelus australis]|uniref:Uncharacterized protein n=1 Tax=Dryococelus australis TaxID=614101 RepID=A0ABQ9HD90_9NEOP|nr:hypothetical protein PR048_018717 [Dryococelus australis]